MAGILAIAGMRGAACLSRSWAQGVPGQALGVLGCLLLCRAKDAFVWPFVW